MPDERAIRLIPNTTPIPNMPKIELLTHREVVEFRASGTPGPAGGAAPCRRSGERAGFVVVRP